MPDFAVPSLHALINSKHEVVAVVTQPDRERDRRIVTPSPVKEEIPTKELESENEIPKYDPNVDRFKDVPAYVVGSEDNDNSN